MFHSFEVQRKQGSTFLPIVHTFQNCESRADANKRADYYMRQRPWISDERHLGQLTLQFADCRCLTFQWERSLRERIAFKLLRIAST